MNYQHVKLQVESDEFLPKGTDLLLSIPLITAFSLSSERRIRLSFGKASCIVRFQPTSQTFPYIRIKESIARELMLPDSFFEICSQYNSEEKTLTIGPLFAILSSSDLESKDLNKEKPFGELTSYFQEFIQAAKEKHSIAYVITLNELKQEETVKGWIYQNGSWFTRVFPLPDVMYNRISSRKIERKEETKNKLNYVKNKGVGFFNDKFLDKWSIHEALIQDPEIAPLLPHTAKFYNQDSLRFFLQKHSYIYLKPVHGSMGSGIIRIEKDKDYCCQYTSMNGFITHRYSTFHKLFEKIYPKLNKRQYIMQQGLHLMTINKEILDFRALVQKDQVGEWNIVSIVARVSNENNIVSNIARGGTIHPLTEALESLDIPLPVVNTRRKIRQTSLKVAKSLEQYLPGEYAELGIDLALDTRGNLWLIEVNSKPSKTTASLAKGAAENKVRRSVVKLMDYCFYRSGFIHLFQHSTRRRSKKG